MPSDVITVAQLKELGVGISLSDASLDLILSGEDEWLQHKAGRHAGVVETIQPITKGRVYVNRPIEHVIRIRVSYHDYQQWRQLDILPSVNDAGTYLQHSDLVHYGAEWDAGSPIFSAFRLGSPRKRNRGTS